MSSDNRTPDDTSPAIDHSSAWEEVLTRLELATSSLPGENDGFGDGVGEVFELRSRAIEDAARLIRSGIAPGGQQRSCCG